jgi:hypothetical protein
VLSNERLPTAELQLLKLMKEREKPAAQVLRRARTFVPTLCHLKASNEKNVFICSPPV